MNRAKCEEILKDKPKGSLMPLTHAIAAVALAEHPERGRTQADRIIRKVEKYSDKFGMGKSEKLLYLLPMYEDALRSIYGDWEEDRPWAFDTDEYLEFTTRMRTYILSVAEG